MAQPPTTLQSYQQSALRTLTSQYNSALNALNRQLTANLNKINALNSSSTSKSAQASLLRSIYNKTVASLSATYATKRRQINALTAIPSSSSSSSSSSKNALLIGINYIGTSSQLSGCINDTANVQTLLRNKYAYSNFTFLTDMTEVKPTKQHIIDALTKLLTDAKEGDRCFFLYSGHGTNTPDWSGDELDGQDELIVPLGATSISGCLMDDEIYSIIQTNLKRGVSLFMLFDSCFSGTIVDLKYSYLTDTADVVVNPNVADTEGTIIVISGCKDTQTSADAYVSYGGKKTFSGAMTWAFLTSLETQTSSSSISLKTLMENMRRLLATEGYDQVPQCSSGTSIDPATFQVSF